MKSQQIRLIKYNFLPLVINYCINQRHEEFTEFQVCLNHFMSYELKIKLFVSHAWFIHSSYSIDGSRPLMMRKVLFQHESISQTFLLWTCTLEVSLIYFLMSHSWTSYYFPLLRTFWEFWSSIAMIYSDYVSFPYFPQNFVISYLLDAQNSLDYFLHHYNFHSLRWGPMMNRNFSCTYSFSLNLLIFVCRNRRKMWYQSRGLQLTVMQQNMMIMLMLE